MGKRADCILIIRGVVFVIEFKVGSDTFDSYAIDQTHDYALDLKNFHLGSHSALIVPILVATSAETPSDQLVAAASDGVIYPLKVGQAGFYDFLSKLFLMPIILNFNGCLTSQNGSLLVTCQRQQ